MTDKINNGFYTLGEEALSKIKAEDIHETIVNKIKEFEFSGDEKDLKSYLSNLKEILGTKLYEETIKKILSKEILDELNRLKF